MPAKHMVAARLDAGRVIDMSMARALCMSGGLAVLG